MADGDGSTTDAGRGFERWALVGVAAVMALAIGVVLLRADRNVASSSPVEDPGGMVTIRIGGGAASDLPPEAPERVAPPRDDPWPPPPEVPRPPPRIDDAAQPRTYVVRKGDTLSEIARRELGSVARMREIVELNGIANPNSIRAGDELRLPPR